MRKVKEELIDLYQTVKVRKISDLKELNNSIFEREKESLYNLSVYDIINYIKCSIDTLVQIKTNEKYTEMLEKEESKNSYKNINDEKDINGLKLYESLLIKAESDIRGHIRIEQELKLRIEDLENELNEIKNNIKNKLKKNKKFIGYNIKKSDNENKKLDTIISVKTYSGRHRKYISSAALNMTNNSNSNNIQNINNKNINNKEVRNTDIDDNININININYNKNNNIKANDNYNIDNIKIINKSNNINEADTKELSPIKKIQSKARTTNKNFQIKPKIKNAILSYNSNISINRKQSKKVISIPKNENTRNTSSMNDKHNITMTLAREIDSNKFIILPSKNYIFNRLTKRKNTINKSINDLNTVSNNNNNINNINNNTTNNENKKIKSTSRSKNNKENSQIYNNMFSTAKSLIKRNIRKIKVKPLSKISKKTLLNNNLNNNKMNIKKNNNNNKYNTNNINSNNKNITVNNILNNYGIDINNTEFIKYKVKNKIQIPKLKISEIKDKHKDSSFNFHINSIGSLDSSSIINNNKQINTTSRDYNIKNNKNKLNNNDNSKNRNNSASDNKIKINNCNNIKNNSINEFSLKNINNKRIANIMNLQKKYMETTRPFIRNTNKLLSKNDKKNNSIKHNKIKANNSSLVGISSKLMINNPLSSRISNINRNKIDKPSDKNNNTNKSKYTNKTIRKNFFLTTELDMNKKSKNPNIVDLKIEVSNIFNKKNNYKSYTTNCNDKSVNYQEKKYKSNSKNKCKSSNNNIQISNTERTEMSEEILKKTKGLIKNSKINQANKFISLRKTFLKDIINIYDKNSKDRNISNLNSHRNTKNNKLTNIKYSIKKLNTNNLIERKKYNKTKKK